MTDCETPVSQVGTELRYMLLQLLEAVKARFYGKSTAWSPADVHSSWNPSLDSEADTASCPHWLKKSHLNHCHRSDQPPPASTHLIALGHRQIEPELVSSVLSWSIMQQKEKRKTKGRERRNGMGRGRGKREKKKKRQERKKLKIATVLVNHFWMSPTFKKNNVLIECFLSFMFKSNFT